jgi:hypothetical protein
MKSTKSSKRDILVILSNRWNKNQKLRYFEVEADEKGNILKEKPLKVLPKTAKYDEVWENDENRMDMASCNRFRRKYPHPLEKAKKGD